MNLYLLGTDTGIGKTFVTAGLIRGLRSLGRDAVGLKPVATGLVQGLNEDVEALRMAAEGCMTEAEVNAYSFEPAIAPHRAAELSGVEIAPEAILHNYRRAAILHQDVLVEGVGGVAVPLSSTWMQTDLVRALDLPVVLVVGVRLGCINHALLSAQAITAGGLRLAGWIANHIDPGMAEPEASVAAISRRLAAPLLGRVSADADLDAFADLSRSLLHTLDATPLQSTARRSGEP